MLPRHGASAAHGQPNSAAIIPGFHRDSSAHSDEADEAALHVRVNQLEPPAIAGLKPGGTAVPLYFHQWRRDSNPHALAGCAGDDRIVLQPDDRAAPQGRPGFFDRRHHRSPACPWLTPFRAEVTATS